MQASASAASCSHTNDMHTAAEDLMTVVSVGCGLSVAVIWSVMFILTLLQSHTHVDTVQTVLHSLANSRHICWSHTMKVLGSHVTFVRRNSATVVTVRYIFAVIVRSVSIQQVKWNVINWRTLVSSSSAAVLVANSTDVNVTLFTTSKRVLLSWDMSICCQCEKIGTESRLSRQLINSTVIIHQLTPIFYFKFVFFQALLPFLEWFLLTVRRHCDKEFVCYEYEKVWRALWLVHKVVLCVCITPLMGRSILLLLLTISLARF